MAGHSLKDAALHYARLGYKIFPVTPLGKAPPLVKNWPNVATFDSERIEQWWSANPQANIGIHCDGMIVVDVEGGTIWHQDHLDILFELSELSHYRVATPRAGGIHYYFRLPAGRQHPLNSVSQPFKGLDIRSLGGYVVAPPSRRDIGSYRFAINGSTTATLDDLPPLEQLEVVPTSVMDWIEEFQKQAASGASHFHRVKRDPTVQITEGTRNDVLFRVGCHLRRIGGNESAILKYLSDQNRTRCQPPLSQREVTLIAQRVVSCYPVNQLAQSDAEGWDAIYSEMFFPSGGPIRLGGELLTPETSPGPPEKPQTFDNDTEQNPRDLHAQHATGRSTTHQAGSPLPSRSVPESAFQDAAPAIQDFVLWCTKTNRRPQPELALGAAVATMLALGSRKIYSLCGGGRTLSHGYIVLLAESGEGKERPRECLLEILRSHERLAHLIGPENFTSPAAIFSALEAQGHNLVAAIDEFGRILGHWRGGNQADNNNAAGNTTALLAIYNNAKTADWRPRGYADSQNNYELHYPHLTVLGSSVPSHVWDSLGVESIGDGVIGRILFFEAPPDRYVHTQRIPESLDPPPSLLALARQWAEFEPAGSLNGRANAVLAPNMQPWRYTPEAETLFDSWCRRIESIRQEAPRIQRAIWSRAPEKACRLILADAIARGPGYGKIDYESVEWGTRLEEFLSRRVSFETNRWCGASNWEKQVQKLVRAVQDSDTGIISGHQVSQILRALKPSERQMVVTDALEQGTLIKISPPPSKQPQPGRPPLYLALPDTKFQASLSKPKTNLK